LIKRILLFLLAAILIISSIVYNLNLRNENFKLEQKNESQKYIIQDLQNEKLDLIMYLREIEEKNEELQENNIFLKEQLEKTILETKTISRSGSKIESEIITTDVSENELKEFYRVVSLEANSNNYEACLAVATVIINRVESNEFPNTILKVVSASGQFSVWSNKNYNRINDTVKQAVDDAILGKKNLPNDCLFFYASYSYKEGKGKILVAEIGDNTFFKYN